MEREWLSGQPTGETQIIGRPIAGRGRIPVRPRPHRLISASLLARPDPITGESRARASPATGRPACHRRGVQIRHPCAYGENAALRSLSHASGVHHRSLLHLPALRRHRRDCSSKAPLERKSRSSAECCRYQSMVHRALEADQVRPVNASWSLTMHTCRRACRSPARSTVTCSIRRCCRSLWRMPAVG